MNLEESEEVAGIIAGAQLTEKRVCLLQKQVRAVYKNRYSDRYKHRQSDINYWIHVLLSSLFTCYSWYEAKKNNKQTNNNINNNKMKQKSILPVLLVLVVVAKWSEHWQAMNSSEWLLAFSLFFILPHTIQNVWHKGLIYLFRNLLIVSGLQATHNSTVLYQLQ